MLNYYFSGAHGFPPDAMDAMVRIAPHRLLSCHGAYVPYIHKWMSRVLQFDKAKEFNTILLDSGAFTAWNQGHPTTIESLMPIYYDVMSKYWIYCKEIYLINLDKIPGSPGRTAETWEVEQAIEESDRNYEILIKEFGNRVLPVFHQGESETRLKEIEKMTEYICVSPRNDLPEKYRVKWSAEVHSKLSKNTKTHGLAATGIEMMVTVPWTSVDSASFIFTCAVGIITTIINGKLVPLSISEKSPNRYDEGKHFQNINPEWQKVFLARIKERDYTVEQLQSNINNRLVFTAMEIQEWVEKYHKFKNKPTGSLFEL